MSNSLPEFPTQLAALLAAQNAGFTLSVGSGTFWAFRKDVPSHRSKPFSLAALRNGRFVWERES